MNDERDHEQQQRYYYLIEFFNQNNNTLSITTNNVEDEILLKKNEYYNIKNKYLCEYMIYNYLHIKCRQNNYEKDIYANNINFTKKNYDDDDLVRNVVIEEETKSIFINFLKTYDILRNDRKLCKIEGKIDENECILKIRDKVSEIKIKNDDITNYVMLKNMIMEGSVLTKHSESSEIRRLFEYLVTQINTKKVNIKKAHNIPHCLFNKFYI